MATVGFDIGGVHTKAARQACDGSLRATSRPFAIEHRLAELPELLRLLREELGGPEVERHAVTMTAELSQLFRTKREGVNAILDAVVAGLGPATLIYAVDGRFLSVAEARIVPLAVAASNWSATARMVARDFPNAILIDTGSTTTDIIPIVNGEVAAVGHTDPERLASGELVYTGVIRTPVESVVDSLPWNGQAIRLSAESFALMGDAYLWLGQIRSEDYTAPTPDRRAATRPYAGERLCRAICADREMLSDPQIDRLARALVERQVDRVADALADVLSRHPALRTVVTTGQGDFLGGAAGRRLGLDEIQLSTRLGSAASRVAPAAAVAWLVGRWGAGAAGQRGSGAEDGQTEGRTEHSTSRNSVAGIPLFEPPSTRPPDRRSARPTVVVKVGGGLTSIPGALPRLGCAIAEAAGQHRIIVIPGGGPFADQVRAFDVEHGLEPEAAHWMAVLAMDQYAFAMVGQIPGGELVESSEEVTTALARGRIPVLAPARWLRSADELPHTWAVTSDSLAAYLATLLGAEGMVLLKPVRGGAELLDDYFSVALARGMWWRCLAVSDVDQLSQVIGELSGRPRVEGAT